MNFMGMDSESYLVKLIRSGSKHTADSLYLRTTIGHGTRWPIVLLMSTALTLLVAVALLVWLQVRRPNRSTSHHEDRLDSVQVFNPSIKRADDDTPFKSPTKSILIKSTTQPYPIPYRGSFGSDNTFVSYSPRRKVSWATSKSIINIQSPRSIRRHSEMGPPRSHVSLSSENTRRFSVPSPLVQKKSFQLHAFDPSLPWCSTPAGLHKQISKTIAVLDDLNKSLQDMEGSPSYHGSVDSVESLNKRRLNKNKKRNNAKPELSSKYSKELKSISGNPISKTGIMPKHSMQGVVTVDELESLLGGQFDML